MQLYRTNITKHLLEKGHRVTIIDNHGSEIN